MPELFRSLTEEMTTDIFVERRHQYSCPPNSSPRRPDGFFEDTPFSLTRRCVHYSLCNIHHIVRTWDGQDMMIILVSDSMRGMDNPALLRRVAWPPSVYLQDNHCLPTLQEVVIGNLVFGSDKCSLENLRLGFRIHAANIVLGYLHSLKVAHRDLFCDNFLARCRNVGHDETSWRRPRLYLIDFELATVFGSSTAARDDVCPWAPTELGRTGNLLLMMSASESAEEFPSLHAFVPME
ncbi:uncharacterized protein BT62DRAFT_917437 [Guyanagaster necrorhizus]|uniref:Protein kinase domain-containing protein n=1 Tax=Guyanagaster necrorhizus TaxID=856835 RepID=A0A9P8AW71_9AGAR|nr:uncharacterized protein BT62DRAFT_917437 [Guyanagaster necrorhizus MCA 3950]KAG7449856.1 hypothetical protein BT62DRAFT_917437 [Guyanagaster necrorhizus MCA 3950]